jgi:hypothetical protein
MRDRIQYQMSAKARNEVRGKEEEEESSSDLNLVILKTFITISPTQ